MFEQLNGFIGRLNDYNRQEITESVKKILVDILGQLLVVLGVATKRMKQNRISKRSQCSLMKTADDVRKQT